jgi:hypothetical protein
MFNNASHIQASSSSFIRIGRDQHINYHIATITDEQPQVLANWISPLSFDEQQDAAFEKYTEGTGTCLLQSRQFKQRQI